MHEESGEHWTWMDLDGGFLGFLVGATEVLEPDLDEESGLNAIEAAVSWETVGAKDAVIVGGVTVVSTVATVVVKDGTEGVLEALEVMTTMAGAAEVLVTVELTAD